MKKKLTLFFCFLISSLICAKAGTGTQGNLKLGNPIDFGVGKTYRSEFSPWGVAVSFNFREISADVVFDNWWVYKEFAPHVNWFSIWGMSFGGKFKNAYYAETGSRLGIGMNAFILKKRNLELYNQIAWNPTIGIDYDHDDKKYSFRFEPVNFPFNTGARFWF